MELNATALADDAQERRVVVSARVDSAVLAEAAAAAERRGVSISAFVRETLRAIAPTCPVQASKRMKNRPRLPGRRLVVVSAKLDDALLSAVEAAAEERGVSLSAFISDALSARAGSLHREAA
jgi:antitoxin component of RelBE/YafQ-DinJ toxin-antitoxin module